jgi:hypothetical protein
LSTRTAVVQGEVVSYLDELLAGYRQGLADDRPTPIAAARAGLKSTVDPNQRGRLLAVIAKTLTDRDITDRHRQGDPSPGLACSLVGTIDPRRAVNHRDTLPPLGWSA